MRTIAIIITLVVTACSASQKAEERAAAKCLGTELSTVIAELESKDSTEQKLAKIAPEVWACALVAKAAAAPGSAGSAQ